LFLPGDQKWRMCQSGSGGSEGVEEVAGCYYLAITDGGICQSGSGKDVGIEKVVGF
jgi:hypothetical protein